MITPRRRAGSGESPLLPEWARIMLIGFAGALVLALLLLLLLLLPARIGGPVRRWLLGLDEGLLGFLGYTTLSLLTMAMRILLYPLFVLSGCGAGVFAVEQGTSWLWIIPWLAGVTYTIRATEESGIGNLIIANGLFLVALSGPMLELAWGGWMAA